MTRLPEASAEPRRTRGGAGGAACGQTEPAWYGQKIKLARRVWGEGRYSPGAVAWHAQITALQKRPEHCRASVSVLAGWMGDGKRTGERYLAELHAPGPDGVPELTTIRHTDPTGDGETAERFTRPVGRDEHFALVPVLAAKTLRHPLFVLYCAITHAEATNTPVTMDELAALLGVTADTARRMVNELERLGWITVHRRTGAHGRHEYTVHDRPLHPVPAATGTTGEPSSDGGSGASADGGSLAIKEDTGLTDQENNPPTAVSVIRRRRPTPASARETAVDTFGRRAGLDLTPAAWRAVRQALAPVREELGELTGWEWERVVTDVLAQLGDGQRPERLADRLQRRYTPMRPLGPGHEQWLATQAVRPDERFRSFSRWLLGAGLVRRGCHDPRCESGVIWGTDPDDHEAGHDCRTCAYTKEAAHTRTQHETEADERQRQTPARRAHTPPQRPAPPPPAPSPPRALNAPQGAPQGRIGPPPGTGGWRSLVARERPQAAAEAYRHRWTGDHAHHLTEQPTGT